MIYLLNIKQQAYTESNQQLAGEHSGAFSSWRGRFFPQELIETKIRGSKNVTYLLQMNDKVEL